MNWGAHFLMPVPGSPGALWGQICLAAVLLVRWVRTTTFKPRNFSGSGSTNIGTIKVPADAVLEWTNQGDPSFRQIPIYDDGFNLSVSSGAPQGESAMPANTYSNVNVAGDDKWTITIRPAK
jgi:hypothetical protein